MIDMRTSIASKNELLEIIKRCHSLANSKLNILEVGVYRGESSEIFLNTGLVDTFYAVDPWAEGYDENDDASSTDMSAVENDFDERIMKRYDNAIKHKGTLGTFVETKFKRIDLVYIDGSHKYQDVKNDITLCIEKIRPTVAISGHDFFWNKGDGGVQKAVFETVGKPDYILNLASWVKFLNTYSWR